jgi:hypothetical protein
VHQDFDFGIEEDSLHKLVPKIELAQIVVTMSKVLPDHVLQTIGGGHIETPRTPRDIKMVETMLENEIDR